MRLWVEASARDAILRLPGNMRRRVQGAINDLLTTSRPSQSRQLAIPVELMLADVEVRRLRIDQWRVVYAIDKQWGN